MQGEDTEPTRTSAKPAVRWSDGGPFGVVPAWVMDAEISDRAVRLYALLARLASSPEEAAMPGGKQEIAERLRCAKSSVEKALGELRTLGAVSVEVRMDGRVRLPNGYVVHASPIAVDLPPPEDTPPAVAGDPPPDGAGDRLSSRELRRGSEANASDLHPLPPAEDGDRAPKLVLVDGRNLPMDALARVSGIPDPSTAAGELAAALNGSRTKSVDVGIRDQAWREMLAGTLGPRVDAGESFERMLSAAIVTRAEQYRAKMPPGSILTPTALAKWWSRLPTLERAGGRGGSAMSGSQALDWAAQRKRERGVE